MYKLLRKYFLRYRGYMRGRINRSRIVWGRRLEHYGIHLPLPEKNPKESGRKGDIHATFRTYKSHDSWISYDFTLSDLKSAQARLEDAGYPLVSCLMPTCDRLSLAQRAVACFQKQTYPNKELVIVDDGADGRLGEWIASLHDSRLRYTRSRGKEKKILGELRNLALENAQGEYIALWDDDDLSHPRRLALQMQMMFFVSADGCFLTSQVLYWPTRGQLADTSSRHWRNGWHNTMIFKKAIVAAEKFPNIKRRVDGILCRKMLPKTKVVLCHARRLYLRTVHGANLWDEEHFEKMMRECGVNQYKGSDYNRILGELSKELRFELGGEQMPPASSD